MKKINCKECGKEFVLPDFVEDPFYCCRFPSLPKQISNLTESAIEHINNDFKTDKNLKESRMKVCNSCEFNIHGSCNQCGCNLETKTLWEISKCPLGRW